MPFFYIFSQYYSAVIPKNGNDKPAAKLHVPEDYAGAGVMVFWAQKA